MYIYCDRIYQMKCDKIAISKAKRFYADNCIGCRKLLFYILVLDEHTIKLFLWHNLKNVMFYLTTKVLKESRRKKLIF